MRFLCTHQLVLRRLQNRRPHVLDLALREQDFTEARFNVLKLQVRYFIQNPGFFDKISSVLCLKILVLVGSCFSR